MLLFKLLFKAVICAQQADCALCVFSTLNFNIELTFMTDAK